MEYFSPAHLHAANQIDPDQANGELVISIPAEAQAIMQEGSSVRVGVEFSLEQPQGGIHFVIPDCEGSLAEVSDRENAGGNFQPGRVSGQKL